MGLTYVDATVTGPSGKSRDFELLVDSGAALLSAASKGLESPWT